MGSEDSKDLNMGTGIVLFGEMSGGPQHHDSELAYCETLPDTSASLQRSLWIITGTGKECMRKGQRHHVSLKFL